MEELTIIYPPAFDYNFMHQRPQQMMKAFAMLGLNVIYVNTASIYPQEKAIVLPYPELPNFKVVRQDYDYSHLVRGKVVLWCAVNQSDNIDKIHHDLAVFDSCDLAIDEFLVWKDVVPAMENKCGITFASAKAIYDEHKKRDVKVVLLPNGADYEHFEKASSRLEKPNDLPETSVKPLIGYYGAVYTWLDVELIYEIANEFPFVVIGNNKWYNIPISHPNITLLDVKPYHDLPKYLSWFDVAIIPFKLTDMIKGCDPVKFYEYLSSGKPVVASHMDELKRFEEVCYFAYKENVVDVIRQAIDENNDNKIKQRQKVAQNNSWLERAKTALSSILNEMDGRRLPK